MKELTLVGITSYHSRPYHWSKKLGNRSRLIIPNKCKNNSKGKHKFLNFKNGINPSITFHDPLAISGTINPH